MAVREGYKQTEVGVIPNDWDVVSIGDISDVRTGPFGSALHEKDYVDNGTPIITVEHLGEHGVIHKNLPMVSDLDKRRLSSYILCSGDIAFSRVGSVDRNALIQDVERGWLFSGRLLRVRVVGKKANPQYLSFHFHSEPFKQRVRCVAVGQTMPSLNTSILKGIEVVLPTQAEQTAIANALSDVDALIQSLDALISKKRLIKQGAMQTLLNPYDEQGQLKDGWSFQYIKDIADISTGAKNTQDKVTDGIYPFFVRSQVVERINSYSFDGEAILTAGDGVGTGKVFHYVNGKFDFHQRVYIISGLKSSIDGYYLFLYFSNNFYSRIMQMTAKSSVDSVRMEMIANMMIPFPPTKKDQSNIATILSDMDTEIIALEIKRSKVQAIKQGMMQNLLTGKIRLLDAQELAHARA